MDFGRKNSLTTADGGSLWNYWRTPSRTKTKDSFIDLSFNYFEVFTVEIQFFFWPFEPRPKEEKKKLLKGTSTSPSHFHQLPFKLKRPFPVCFLSILRKEENSRRMDDQFKVGEETVKSRWCIEKNSRRQVRNGSEQNKMTHFQTLPTCSLYSVSFKIKLQ